MANNVIKKNIRQLLINPVSLNLEKSKKEFKKKFKIKEPFFNRVQVYKKKIKEELFDNKTRNLSSINESNLSKDIISFSGGFNFSISIESIP